MNFVLDILTFIFHRSTAIQNWIYWKLCLLPLLVLQNIKKYSIGKSKQQSFRGVWLLLLAIGSHKFIIALCIGQQLVTNKVNKCLIVSYIMTFSLTTIIGAGAGKNQRKKSFNGNNDSTNEIRFYCTYVQTSKLIKLGVCCPCLTT